MIAHGLPFSQFSDAPYAPNSVWEQKKKKKIEGDTK